MEELIIFLCVGTGGGTGGTCPQYFWYIVRWFHNQLLDVLMNELKRRFQQKRGICIAALIEKTLIDHSNGTSDSTSNLMSDLEMYKNDLDLGTLSI